MYHAYATVHHCVTQPFHTLDPATLLNAARFLTCLFNAPNSRGQLPLGVSQAHVLYTMAKNGEALEVRGWEAERARLADSDWLW